MPSPYLDALHTNRAYLLSLDPDRLLHGYHVQAGLPPRAPPYGGWEADSIAGHTLGHVLSALSLLHAQTDDPDARARVTAIVAELARCQHQAGDGYVGAFTRRRDGRIEPGRLIFEEIRRGTIRARPFTLNEGWAPLYNWHKLFAGLLDAESLCAVPQARTVAEGLAGYLDGVLSTLDDDRMQTVLGCEYGGLNESMAELAARTGNRRWAALAARIDDTRTLGPLQRGHAALDGQHANTLIAKTIGQARLYELTGQARYRTAAETLWEAVTRHHLQACGGTGDREYFTAPDSAAAHPGERTCETCATYNMLKLTCHVHAWAPHGRHFDYYEHAHINHILAQQHPRTGMFAYMMPMGVGAARNYSTPHDDFWCCVGTGLESHARHGEAIWWQRGRDELAINLFIPSSLAWPERRAHLTLDTRYPRDGEIAVTVERMGDRSPLTIALRLPAWSGGHRLAVNGQPVDGTADPDGYVRIRRTWRAGDRLAYTIALPLRVAAPARQGDTVSFLRGPVLLCADLGPARGEFPYRGPVPVVLARDPLQAVRPLDREGLLFQVPGADGPLLLRPFTPQHDRLSAPCLPCVAPEAWTEDRRQVLQRQFAPPPPNVPLLDRIDPDDPGSQARHALAGRGLAPIRRLGRPGWAADSLSVRLETHGRAADLQIDYYDDDVCRLFHILLDGQVVATEALPRRNPGVFVTRRYALPRALTRRGRTVTIAFQPAGERGVGDIYGLALVPA
nr:glycoside hydrolase family 127 protein [Gluconacetobacter takamatsuzukensis]